MTEKGCDLPLIDIQCDPIHGLDHLFVTRLGFERLPDIVNPAEHKITKWSEMYLGSVNGLNMIMAIFAKKIVQSEGLSDTD